MAETTKYDKALRELAEELYISAKIHRLEHDLREALLPLLEAATRAADQLYNAAYQDHVQHHRQASKLYKLLEEKWKR